MLEKPSLPDERIIRSLRETYGLRAASLEFLPLGADAATAVYRVVDDRSQVHFLKLRGGVFEENSATIPDFLHSRGVREIIPLQKTRDGRLWARLDAYTCILYPYIEGRNGFETALSGVQWAAFGAALKAVHTIDLPAALRAQLPVETYSPCWRERVRAFQAQVEKKTFDDPIAARMAESMRAHRGEIDRLVARAGQLAGLLRAQPLEFVLCHSDVHAANLLLAEDGALYIVDWDNPILAPKERDLMFIGGGIGSVWNSAGEEALFYRGYGAAEINPAALAYYRYERIIEDIAAFCGQILPTRGDGPDREQGLGYFTGNFDPGGVLDIARRAEERLFTAREEKFPR